MNLTQKEGSVNSSRLIWKNEKSLARDVTNYLSITQHINNIVQTAFKQRKKKITSEAIKKVRKTLAILKRVVDIILGKCIIII